MKIAMSTIIAAAALAACSPGGGSAEDRAAKAAALGVEISDFDGVEPILLSLAERNDVLVVALSLRKDFPKAAKRQIQFEVLTTGMDCVTTYGDAEKGFNQKLEQFEERFTRRTMQMGTAGTGEFDAFAEAVRARRGENLAKLVDVASLIPVDTAAKLAEGEPPKGDTPSLAQCQMLFNRMGSGRFDS